MDHDLIIAFLAVAVPAASVAGALITARVQHRRDAGALALSIAHEARDQVQGLIRWQRAVMRWWPQHERYDMAMRDELARHDPTAEGRLPKAPPAPIWGTDDNERE